MDLHKHINSIITIDNFWTNEECENFISKSELMGYELATIDTGKGQKLVTEVRNNNRVMFSDTELGDNIWLRLNPFAPQQFGNSMAVGLNELFRVYKYQPGQQFKKHRDQSFIRNDIEASYYTFMIYLNDNYEGRETSFNHFMVQPKKGMALVFQHDLEHEGASVTEGIKYVLRTDIMFKLVQ